MTDDLPLFARRTDPPTSHAAAASMRDYAEAQRWMIVQLLGFAKTGLTADEIDLRAGWRPTTAGRRLGELVRTGRVRVKVVNGEPVTRPTRSGRPAQVYVATDHQEEAA
jgi:predicted ArsR family transcriptional regulator